ncbi:hypothetical protein Dimus_038413 [Dionaea muscipula]
MGSAPDLPIEEEGNVQLDMETYEQTPTAEGAGAGGEGRMMDVGRKTPSKMKSIKMIGQERMDAPAGEAEHHYFDALKSISSSNVRKQLDKIRREEELALMERNLAEEYNILTPPKLNFSYYPQFF